MDVLIYDGSFEGFLTAIYDCYYERYKPVEILRCEPENRSFLDSYVLIKTDNEKSEKVYHGIQMKLGADFMKRCYMAHLAENHEANIRILQFIRRGFSQGRAIQDDLTDPAVFTVETLKKKVEREKHRLLGLTRFSVLDDGTLFSTLEPRYDVLSLIAPHFADRFPSERWAIYDQRRKVAVIGHMGTWVRKDVHRDPKLLFHPREEEYRNLWKEFHRSVSIEERKNPGLQKQWMPKYYWKHLTEKSSPSEDGEDLSPQ